MEGEAERGGERVSAPSVAQAPRSLDPWAGGDHGVMQAPSLPALLTLGGLFCYAPGRGSLKEFGGRRRIQALLKLPLACLNEERGFSRNRLELEPSRCHSSPMALGSNLASPGPFPLKKKKSDTMAGTIPFQVCENQMRRR